MTKLSITITKQVEISVDGKYCDSASLTMCQSLQYAHCRKPRCVLFHKNLEHCLGGGTLRCEQCLAAEVKQ